MHAFVGRVRQIRVFTFSVRNCAAGSGPLLSQFVPMTTTRPPLWYRHAWWVPGAWSAFAITLVAAALRPTEQSVLLAIAILCALPWSLVLLLLDFGQGFADRAAWVVCSGICVNAALLWWTTALLRARFRQRQNTHPRAA